MVASGAMGVTGSDGDGTAELTRRFVSDFFREERDMGTRDDALLVLNYHLPAVTPALWQRATRRFCADGGANRLFDELPALLPGEDAAEVRYTMNPELLTQNP
jgi:hypothetical protein